MYLRIQTVSDNSTHASHGPSAPALHLSKPTSTGTLSNLCSMCSIDLKEAIEYFCALYTDASQTNMKLSLQSSKHTCDCEHCGLKETKFCNANETSHSATHFTIWSIVEGHRVKSLANTGADTNFVDAAFAATLDVKPTPCRPRAIRLGNNSIHHINSCLVLETWVG
eukprot:SAG11_NODE_5073_length_1672_cov_6.848061_2_plen_166_part_01